MEMTWGCKNGDMPCPWIEENPESREPGVRSSVINEH